MGNDERNRGFGKYVQSLRTENGLTQKQLATATNNRLTEKQIADVEQGRVSDLRYHLEVLADAFSLYGLAREDFYQTAGYVSPDLKSWNKDTVCDILRRLYYPAFIRRLTWDLVAFNNYHYVLWKHSSITIDELKNPSKNSQSLKLNQLPMLFNPIFKHRQLIGGEERWRIDVARSVQEFKYMSMDNDAMQRREEVVTAMCQTYPEFNALWQTVEVPAQVDEFARRTIAVITDYGKIEFVWLTMPLMLVDSRHVDIVIYMPTRDVGNNNNERNYQSLRTAAEKNSDVEPFYIFDKQFEC